MTTATNADVRLPKPPGVLRRLLADHPFVVDVFIVVWYVIGAGFGAVLDVLGAAASLAGYTPGNSLPDYLMWPWWPVAALRILLVAAALLYRRKLPLTGLIVVAISCLGEHGIQSFATSVALCFMIYAVPVYRSVAAGWVGFGVAYVTTILQGILPQGFAPAATFEANLEAENAALDPVETIANQQELWGVAIVTGVWYLAILLIGINLGNRRRYLAAIIDRAHQLVNERDQLAKLAVAEERERISREMHDIVAHSLTVMIALSEGAARAATNAPEAAINAMRKSAETGRNALAETRRLLGALSEGETALVPQPALSDLPELVQGFRVAGLQVGLRLEGPASGDRGQELAVYRAVQEALTNTLRYAGQGSRAEVIVISDTHETRVSVRDYGPISGSTPPRTGLGAGKGLAGMTERARMLGGTAHSGPADSGPGWQLRVTLPAAISADGAQGTADPEPQQETEKP